MSIDFLYKEEDAQSSLHDFYLKIGASTPENPWNCAIEDRCTIFDEVLRYFSSNSKNNIDNIYAEYELLQVNKGLRNIEHHCICSQLLENKLSIYYIQNIKNSNILMIGVDCKQRFLSELASISKHDSNSFNISNSDESYNESDSGSSSKSENLELESESSEEIEKDSVPGPEPIERLKKIVPCKIYPEDEIEDPDLANNNKKQRIRAENKDSITVNQNKRRYAQLVTTRDNTELQTVIRKKPHLKIKERATIDNLQKVTDRSTTNNNLVPNKTNNLVANKTNNLVPNKTNNLLANNFTTNNSTTNNSTTNNSNSLYISKSDVIEIILTRFQDYNKSDAKELKRKIVDDILML